MDDSALEKISQVTLTLHQLAYRRHGIIITIHHQLFVVSNFLRPLRKERRRSRPTTVHE